VLDQFNRDNIIILQNLKYDITIAANFSFGNTTSVEKIKKFKNELIKQKIKVIDIPIPRKINPVFLVRSYFIVKKLLELENYSLIHCHTPIASCLLRINYLISPVKSKEKIIYTAHGFHFYKGAPVINWLLYYPLEKIFSSFTDCLITINHEDYILAKKSFKMLKYIFQINGVGVDLNRYYPLINHEKISYRVKHGYSEKQNLIISVAELNDNKNQILIIEAIRHLVKERTDFMVLLIGIGSQKEKLQSIVKTYSLDDNINFLGYRNDVDSLLKISDIFLASSKREGLGIAVIEAMATGLPIIATDNRGHRELIKNGRNGFLVPTNNPIFFSKRINELLSSKVKKKEFSANNVRAIKKYSKGEINVQMKNIFSEIINYNISK